MRVSTATIFDKGTNTLLQHQETLFRTQQQVSTGKRILTPADDPVGAVRALAITQADSLNTQYSANRDNAMSSLGLLENVLKEATTLIQSVHTTAITAGNPTLSDADRKSIGIELRGKLNALVGLANSRDGLGQFLFSGFQGDIKPFIQTKDGVQYNGDQGQRLIQVSETRQLAVNNSGVDIFERIKNGNGVFTTAADTDNKGSGIIDAGTIITPASLTGDNYEIIFTVEADATTYDILDTTTDAVLVTANPYTNGDTIQFDGMKLGINGVPANGDRFVVSPSTNQSLFKTINDLLDVVETPASIPSGETRLTNGLNAALQNINHGLDHILAVRASVGARLQEVDALRNMGDDLKIQFQQSLSQIQDVDYAEAISNLTQQKLYLEAAQKSFMTISNLSLFNLL
ncbi:flagellar hook-associated protein 3 FlgL [Nitrosomonas cryotolerans]|uniref:Flagellar hook-associated protein 3 FlgL n=1 Tax=Nitrosomonas cryotolerans ATCC 49181 TaxID=1131553 RepID=A0A1N6ILK5_9PROT|nr:flagellar hook-associated protein FlgL [Nitrosomonas cryotolerans]SFP37091.1 flagellar hook-associated protein 3 FlgL [Nitrosomonas cryotolerans]SIO32912.1 flagellar hook-associated protein 3 FlgL [Nitrosomonas cryotolerans ATCC 49181]